MFETVDPDRYFRLRMFALHQVAALMLPFLIGGVVYLSIPLLADAFGWAAGPVLGAVAANASRKKKRRGYEACWVWVFPLSLLVISILSDLRAHPMGWVAKTYFDVFWNDPDSAEGRLEIQWFTIPAWSCCSYSLSYFVVRRWQA